MDYSQYGWQDLFMVGLFPAIFILRIVRSVLVSFSRLGG